MCAWQGIAILYSSDKGQTKAITRTSWKSFTARRTKVAKKTSEKSAFHHEGTKKKTLRLRVLAALWWGFQILCKKNLRVLCGLRSSKTSGSDLFCGLSRQPSTNEPRIFECAPRHSFIREKFVDGLGKNSKTTKSTRIRKTFAQKTRISLISSQPRIRCGSESALHVSDQYILCAFFVFFAQFAFEMDVRHRVSLWL